MEELRNKLADLRDDRSLDVENEAGCSRERREVDEDIREILKKIEDRLQEEDGDEVETPPAEVETGEADETDEIELVVLSGDVSADRTREGPEVFVFAETPADLENAEPGEREEIHRALGRENDAQLEGEKIEGSPGAEAAEDPVDTNEVEAEQVLEEGSRKKKRTRRFIRRKQWRRTKCKKNSRLVEEQKPVYTNYSRHILTEGQKKLLNRGPGFVIMPERSPMVDMKEAEMRMKRCMRFDLYFKKQEMEAREEAGFQADAEERWSRISRRRGRIRRGGVGEKIGKGQRGEDEPA